MTLKLPSLALLAAVTATAIAQTSTAPQKPAVHHTPTSAKSSATTKSSSATKTPAAKEAVSAKDNPPNVPKIAGTPQPLYALRYVDTVIGTGPLAEQRKYYTVHYTGWLTDGTKFDSSVDRGTPITFPYGARQVIPGWDTGFEGMHVGGKRRLYIPYQLAYGESGRPPVIPAKADLIFDLELIGQSDTPPAPPAPERPASEPQTKPESTSDSKPAETAPQTPSHPEAK
jgi:peptidylprolyl isomerase